MDKVFRKAARSALVEWETDLTSDDLVHELWVWYLESPGVQETLEALPPGAVLRYARSQALNILAGNALVGDVFQGRALYSSEAVKDALKGRSTNRFLGDILPMAMESLGAQNEGYAEAIRSRYTDGKIPTGGTAQDALKNAHRALTGHVNILVIKSDYDASRGGSGPGSRAAVFPETVKRKGAHGDPVGDLAVSLVGGADPEIRDAFYEVPPVDLLLKGAHAQPVRWDVQRNAWVRDVSGSGDPGAVPPREADADPELVS